MAQCRDDLVGAQCLGLAGGLIEHLQAAQLPLASLGLQFQVNQLVLEADVAAECNDLLTQVLHHLDQLEGADVRMGFDQESPAALRR